MIKSMFEGLISKYLGLINIVEEEFNKEYRKFESQNGKMAKIDADSRLAKLQKYLNDLENNYEEIFRALEDFTDNNILNKYKFNKLKEFYEETRKELKVEFPELFNEIEK